MEAELRQHVDREYSVQRLEMFVRVATAFPPSKRKSGMTFEFCREAGTPENLAAIRKAASTVKRSRPISTRDVREIIKDHTRRHADTPKTERPPLLGEEVATFFDTANVWGGLASVLVKLRAIEKELTPALAAQMSDAAIAACAEDCEIGTQLFREIRAKLREHGRKGAHLVSVPKTA